MEGKRSACDSNTEKDAGFAGEMGREVPATHGLSSRKSSVVPAHEQGQESTRGTVLRTRHQQLIKSKEGGGSGAECVLSMDGVLASVPRTSV